MGVQRRVYVLMLRSLGRIFGWKCTVLLFAHVGATIRAFFFVSMEQLCYAINEIACAV